jgi:hypothetical protein
MNGAATQIASKEFDSDFFRLPQQIQVLVQRRIDSMSLRLATFPHYRMAGSDRYRLQIADWGLPRDLSVRYGSWRNLSAGDWQSPGDLPRITTFGWLPADNSFL